MNVESHPEKIPFLRDLIKRRVPQILGGYLAGGWIILEFLGWLVKRYPISPHLEVFFLVAIASLIPTVLLLAWFHGKPGKEQWTRVEKIGIPTNLVISAVMLFFIFRGQDLGATTTSVTLINEQGEQVERSVPKSEFRKKVTIFSLENESGDATLDWLSHSIPDMIRYDLIQDIYLDIKSVFTIYQDVKMAGYPEALHIPLPLKKKLAGEAYTPFFTSGNIRNESDQLMITLILYDTKTTKRITEHVFTGEDIFNLVDEMSRWLKTSLSLPGMHIENTEDLPVAEIMTKSLPALKALYEGFENIVMKDKWSEGIKQVEHSIHLDTTFTYAYVNLSAFYILSNEMEKYMQVFEPLMKYIYKLPEKTQYAIKHDYYYIVKQDPDMALEVAKNWAELYPDDLRAHNVLAQLYRIRNQRKEELAEYMKILELDPEQYDLLLSVGSLYKNLGDFEKALTYYEKYAEQFPNNVKSFIGLGDLHQRYGNYKEAKNYYRKVLLIEPDHITALLSLARIETESGNFRDALNEYERILETCNTPEDRSEVYYHLENYHFMRGQIIKSAEFLDLKIAEMEKFKIQIAMLDEWLEALDLYILAGRKDEAFDYIKTIEKTLGPPLDMNIPFGYLYIYLELNDVEKAEKALAGAEAAIQAMDAEMHRGIILNASGRISEMKKDYSGAIENYLDQFELEPTNMAIEVDLGRCFRKSGNFKKAEDHLETVLEVHPFWPKANTELALVYFETGKIEKALHHIKRANEIWMDADPGYKPANKAREKLAEVENSLN